MSSGVILVKLMLRLSAGPPTPPISEDASARRTIRSDCIWNISLTSSVASLHEFSSTLMTFRSLSLTLLDPARKYKNLSVYPPQYAINFLQLFGELKI